MNYFTELSIELATQRDYLDQLFRVYPLAPDNIRSISKDIWEEIQRAYIANNNVDLINSLLKLKLFPIKDSYLPFLRKDKGAIQRNPQTVNRICGRIYELGLDKLYEKISEPKETNRQIGPLFKRWIDSGALGIKPCAENEFLNCKDNVILSGTDSSLKEFAARYLDFERDDDKGPDFIGHFNGTYIIGEAKFLTDKGGHQNAQFLDAMTSLKKQTRADVKTVAILDGVLYIPSRKKIFSHITSQNLNVMSALVLRDFLFSI